MNGTPCQPPVDTHMTCRTVARILVCAVNEVNEISEYSITDLFFFIFIHVLRFVYFSDRTKVFGSFGSSVDYFTALFQ